MPKENFPDRLFGVFLVVFTTNSKSKLKIEWNFPRKMYQPSERRPNTIGNFSSVYTSRRCFSVKCFLQTQRFWRERAVWRWSLTITFQLRIETHPRISLSTSQFSMCVHTSGVWCSSRSILIEQCSSLWKTKSSETDHVWIFDEESVWMLLGNNNDDVIQMTFSGFSKEIWKEWMGIEQFLSV